MNQWIGRNKFGRGLLVVALPVFLAACHSSTEQLTRSSAQQYCAGNVYLMRYNCSIDRIQSAAESGVPDAQYALGYMYYYGIDTVRDQRTAEMWIKKAAAQGQPLAKKAWHLIQSDADFSDLHRAAGGHNSGRARSTYQSHEDVAQMNQRVPEKPISDHLPGYKKKVSTGVSDTEKASPTAKQPKTKVAPPPLTKKSKPVVRTSSQKVIADPRLMQNAKPILAEGLKPTTKPAGNNRLVHKGNIDSLNPTHYMLQLMGSYDLGMIKGFVARNRIGGKAHYFTTRMKGRTWYMLVYGDYANVHDATRALKSLPRSLRTSKPWVKSARSLSKEVTLQRIIS